MNASGLKRNFKKRMAIFICLTQLIALFSFAETINAADSSTLPDLVVTRIVISPENPQPGDLVTLSAVIKNQGVELPGNSKFTVGCDFGDGIYYYSDSISKALKNNETLTVACTGGSGADGAKWKASQGKHVLKFMVDNFANPDTGYRVVKESNENNNALQMTVTVAAQDKLSITPKATPELKNQTGGAYYISSDKNEKVDEGIGKLTEEVKNLKNTMEKLSKVNKNKKTNKALLDQPSKTTVANLTKYPIKKVVVGSTNKTNTEPSKFSAYWDEKNLYVLINVIDAVKIKDSVNVWDDDAVEILLDMDHDKGPAYGPDDFQYFFNWNAVSPTEVKQNALTGVSFLQADTEKGYVVFATIPWTTVGKTPKENSFIGFDVAIDDDNNKAARESQTMWNAKDALAYSHPDRFGDLQLLKGNSEPGSVPEPAATPVPTPKPPAPEYKVPVGRGAEIPWTEYEAENGITSGKVIGPTLALGDKAAEASGRKYVELSSIGEYVEFTTTNTANSIVVRYSIPDALEGGGISAPISLYVNGVYKQDLILTSKYSWIYGPFPWYNDPSFSSAHHYFDETRALIGDIPVGSKIKLQVDGKDILNSYDIDLIDLEQVDPALTKPVDFLSITDFGAEANDSIDDTNAINACITAAKAESKGVWIPEGTFNRTSGPKIETANSGYSGSGYIKGYETIGATTRVDVSELPSTGKYTTVLRYSNGSGIKQTVSLFANGTKVGQVSLDPTANWKTWANKSITIKLNKGNNGIEVIRDNDDSGNIALDYLKVNNLKYEMESGYFTCPIYVDNVSIKGAGMWYSKLEGYYNQFVCKGDNCKFYDFSILGETDNRNDSLGDNAFAGNAGTGSILKNIWVEHTKCGFWVGNSNKGRTDGLLISGCRFRNTMADGINLCDGTTNSIIENCTARNTGDDSFAIWSATYNTTKWGTDNNIIRHNTTQQPWLAQGIALYGGKGNIVEDNLIIDTPTASGILVSTTFPCIPFSGITTVRRNSIVRSGSLENGFGGFRVMCDTQFGIKGLKVSDLDIFDTTDSGIRFMGSSALSNTTFDNININYCGMNGIYASIEVNGSAIFKNVTVKNSTAAGLRDNTSSKFKFTKDTGNSGW